MAEPSRIVVRDFERPDLDAVLTILADSFIDYTPIQMMVGTDGSALARLERFMGVLFRDGTKTRAIVAERDGRVVGVLTYTDAPACSAISPSELFTFARVAGRRILWTIRVFAKVERVHLKTPHRHLPVVGVDPTRQGQGIGGALLDEFVRGCEEAGQVAFLETIRWTDPHEPSLPRFYGRYGFAVSHEVRMSDTWSFVTMTRPLGGAGEED